MATWFILICAAFLFLYLYLQRKCAYWSLRGVPGKSSLYDVAKMLYEIFKKPVFETQLEDYKKYGRIYGTFEGPKPMLFVGEPSLLKNILVKDFHLFRNRMKIDVGDPIFERMLQFARDDRWKRIRCIMSPTFTSGRMRKMCSLVKECSDNLINNCKDMAEKNQEFDCKLYLGAYALDVVASTAFGTKLNSMIDSKNDFVKNARSLVSEDASLFVVLIGFFPFILRLTGKSVFKGIMEYFCGVSSHIIEERKEQNIKGYDFLQLMMDAHEGTLEVTAEDIAEMNEEKRTQVLPKHKTLTKDEMLSQCVLFLLVGNETTSNTMSFINYCLALNPDCQDRLLQEIDETWEKHGEMNFDIINKLPYLDAVINETLRLYPILFWLQRESAEEYTLGDTGITVPKGCPINIPIYSMQRDPEFFPDPEKFIPDRFLPENKHLIPQYAYMPFGEGPRNCIGMRFALMTIKLAMTHLLHEVRMVATEETKKPLKFYLGQGLSVPKAVVLKMEKRKK